LFVREGEGIDENGVIAQTVASEGAVIFSLSLGYCVEGKKVEGI
jgi:hypothetical protein